VRSGISDRCQFVTPRLQVSPWHAAAHEVGVGLVEVTAGILTARTTVALPESWRGDYSIERARAWIEERDAESPTMLVIETASERPVGFVVLAEVPLDKSAVDVRIGFLIAEDAWGRGLATELLSGLVDWAQTQPGVRTLTGGVEPKNRASARVLEKSGFRRVGDRDDGAVTYRLDIEPSNEWDRYAQSWDGDAAARAYAAAAFASLQDVGQGAGIALDGAEVIDFGCGTGLLTERLVAAGATVEAVDTSTAMLDVLDSKIVERHWASVRTGTALPLEGFTFDLVVCSSVCSFLDDYPGTIGELVTRLRAGGLFVQWDWERADEDSHGLTRDEILEALTRAGLVDIAVSAAFTVEVAGQRMTPLVGHGRRPLESENTGVGT
jgi:RimJ/RimL family protein N-acetyltransferase